MTLHNLIEDRQVALDGRMEVLFAPVGEAVENSRESADVLGVAA